MSIVGTRPPLPNEWEAYELHHRATAMVYSMYRPMAENNQDELCALLRRHKWIID